MEWKLEVVAVPVTDVDRAKWRMELLILQRPGRQRLGAAGVSYWRLGN